MRKRRRLANKMTIMVCAVLFAVSAFFYAPMDVSAEEINVGSGYVSYSPEYNTSRVSLNKMVSILDSSFDDNTYYNIRFLVDGYIDFSDDIEFVRNIVLSYSSDLFLTYIDRPVSDNFRHHAFSSEFRIVCKGSYLKNQYLHAYFRVLDDYNMENVTYDFNVDFQILDYKVISGVESESYQQGYNAGYSAGEQAGESNGYSNGYSDGYEAGEQSGYDTGFQAGKDSVDTQSYYDAGYQAGYQMAYSDGYESGYDSGYQDAMDRFANWGADTTVYPKLLTTKTMSKWGIPSEVQVGVVQDIHATLGVDLGVSVDPNHTYMFEVAVSDYDVTGPSTIDSPANHDLFFYVGSNKYYLISQNKTSCNQTLYVPGSIISDVFGFSGDAYNVHVLESQSTDQIVYTYLAYTVKMFDMGPSGDTQNHIANQTDQLTHGYDDSKGNTVNSELSTGLNEFETAENSLFATATTGMRDFTFFDFESVPAMLTAVTFITSIMGSWFEQAGGASGVGIVLSILFSVMLVSMVLGLYRLYQSAGHRAEARERHRERMEQWKRGK